MNDQSRTTMKAKTILADPPWSWKARSARGEGRAASNHYEVMSLDEIKALKADIDEWADKDCTLCLWATMPMLPQALEVMAAWGFAYKTVGFTWTKINKDGTPFAGLGFWTRANAELCLLGTRGQPKRQARDVPQAVMSPRGRHSAKPPEVRQRIERLLEGPYLEMFARERVPNWHAWGDEI